MEADRNRMSRLAAMTLILAFTAFSASHAKDVGPVEVLKGQGLKRSTGSTWVLLAEDVILKDVRTARELSAQLRYAQDQQQALEVGNQNPQVFIDNYRQQIDWLDQRIGEYDRLLAEIGPSVGNRAADIYHNLLVQERNAIVGEQRRLNTLINNLAEQRGQFRELKQQFNGEVARLRESYVQAVSELRKAINEIKADYAVLMRKEEISKALKDLTASSKITQKLGPSKDLANAIKGLGKFESSVQSETVELHRENGVDHLDVMLNGKGPFKMVFDTGAGPTTLSATLAAQLNLKPTGRTVQVVVADGNKVMAREMIIRTVSVGRLSVKNVTCVVMPKEKGDVDPLLGQSFLERFDFKYTQGAGQIVFTKVEPDEPATVVGKGKAPKKKR